MIKHVMVTGATVAILGIHPYVHITRLSEGTPSPALYGNVLAPYVPIQHSDKFIQPTLCKIEDEEAPITEQIEQCKKQRLGWLKI